MVGSEGILSTVVIGDQEYSVVPTGTQASTSSTASLEQTTHHAAQQSTLVGQAAQQAAQQSAMAGQAAQQAYRVSATALQQTGALRTEATQVISEMQSGMQLLHQRSGEAHSVAKDSEAKSSEAVRMADELRRAREADQKDF